MTYKKLLNKILIIYGILLICIIIFLAINMFTLRKSIGTAMDDSITNYLMYNNAGAVYCKNLSYQYEVRNNENGQYGICIFTDGTECEIWNFFNGKCGQKFTFCERQGFRIETKSYDPLGKGKTEYAVCVFDDDSECSEYDYFVGKCNRSECKEWKRPKACINP